MPAAKRCLRRHWQLQLLVSVPVVWFVVFRCRPKSNAVIAVEDDNVVDGPRAVTGPV